MRMLQQIYIRFVKLRPSWFDKSLVSSWNVTQLTGMPYNQGKWRSYLGKSSPFCKCCLDDDNFVIRASTRVLHSLD